MPECEHCKELEARLAVVNEVLSRDQLARLFSRFMSENLVPVAVENVLINLHGLQKLETTRYKELLHLMDIWKFYIDTLSDEGAIISHKACLKELAKIMKVPVDET